MTQRPSIVFVSGPSGAGRSTALRALEDFGFEAIDNLPLTLLPRLLDGRPLERPVALTLDSRNRDFSADAPVAMLASLRADPAYDAALVYLECRSDVLLRRFSETRRRHPFAGDAAPAAAIDRERDALHPLRTAADILIDTSEFSPHDLRAALSRRFESAASPGLHVSVESFSFKAGLPQDLDTAFDVRFLSNPHWDADLRPLDGRDPRVAAHVSADPRFAPFVTGIAELILSLLPAYAEEGKSHFALGFGCTGGRHRSVVLAENLGKTLAEAGWQVSIRHRGLPRGGAAASGPGRYA